MKEQYTTRLYLKNVNYPSIVSDAFVNINNEDVKNWIDHCNSIEVLKELKNILIAKMKDLE